MFRKHYALRPSLRSADLRAPGLGALLTEGVFPDLGHGLECVERSHPLPQASVPGPV